MTYMDWPALQAYVHFLFDNSVVDEEEIPLGGQRKADFFFESASHPDDHQLACAIDDAARHIPGPLAKLLAHLRALFAPLYTTQDPSAYEEEKLSSAYFIALLFKEALRGQGWHADD